jgi:hypothetical protein
MTAKEMATLSSSMKGHHSLASIHHPESYDAAGALNYKSFRAIRRRLADGIVQEPPSIQSLKAKTTD